MPSGPVHDKDGVGARRRPRRDFIEMPLRGLGVAARRDEGRADTAPGTDGVEDVGRLRAVAIGHRGPTAAWRPAPGELGLPTDSGVIPPPNFHVGVDREPIADRFHLAEDVFLKSSTANSFRHCCAGEPKPCGNPGLSTRGPRSIHQARCETLRISIAQDPSDASAPRRGSSGSARFRWPPQSRGSLEIGLQDDYFFNTETTLLGYQRRPRCKHHQLTGPRTPVFPHQHQKYQTEKSMPCPR